MAKNKTKKKKNKKKGQVATARASAAKAADRLKSLTQNPLVADIVAAALVATAAALKDSRKARQLAEQAGDELETLAREGAERGNAMWQLALDVGRRTLDTLAGEERTRGKATTESASKASAGSARSTGSGRKASAASGGKPK